MSSYSPKTSTASSNPDQISSKTPKPNSNIPHRSNTSSYDHSQNGVDGEISHQIEPRKPSYLTPPSLLTRSYTSMVETGGLLGVEMVKVIRESKVRTREGRGMRRKVVSDFVDANDLLRNATVGFFIVGILDAVVENRLFKCGGDVWAGGRWFRRRNERGRVKSQKSGLMEIEEMDGLTEEDGRVMGGCLAISLATTLTADRGVDEWILQFPVLQQFDSKYVWFRPMMVQLGYGLVSDVRWGVKARVFIGAATSMTDLATDLYITHMFYETNEYLYFQASLASLVTSIAIQLVLVYGNFKRLGWLRVLQEAAPVLVGLKPAVDSYRVASGVRAEAGTTYDAHIEMTAIKLSELFAEAIPGAIIQLMAIANTTENESTPIATWLSISISSLMTGFAAASVSYDFDTDPHQRASSAKFYGMIPPKLGKRSIIFATMLIIGAGTFTIRCTTIMLLILIGKRWTLAYVCGELGLYLTVKLLRGDFWYWIPIGGKSEILLSLLSRVVVKVVTDFTSMPQLRNPQELGGAYYTFNCFVTFFSLPAVIKFYEAKDGEAHVLAFSWTVAWSLIPITIITFAIYFATIDSTYLRTFISLETGIEYNVNRFVYGESDLIKADATLNSSKHVWISIEEEVRVWVESNWSRWEEEKPLWLDEACKARVPIDYIPDADRNKELKRRTSVHASPVINSIGKAIGSAVNQHREHQKISYTEIRSPSPGRNARVLPV